VTGFPPAKTIELGAIEAIIDNESQELQPALLRGQAIADYIIAAVSKGDNEAAANGLNQLYLTMTSTVPPATIVRAAAVEIEQKSDDVQKRIAADLRISNANQIRSKFIAYRRSIDSLLKDTETRRLQLLLMLTRIIRNGGLEVVKTVVSDPTTNLAKEVNVDSLGSLLFVAAAEVDLKFPEMAATDRNLAVALVRLTPAEEVSIMRALVSVWSGYLQQSKLMAFEQLEAAPKANGLCSATARFLAEKLTMKASSAAESIAEIKKMNNKLWREECLQAATRLLVRKKLLDVGKVRPAISEAATDPSQRIAAFYGAVRGAVDLENKKPATP
jgi:hypothetical protein